MLTIIACLVCLALGWCVRDFLALRRAAALDRHELRSGELMLPPGTRFERMRPIEREHLRMLAGLK